jgi:hypothetical protein
VSFWYAAFAQGRMEADGARLASFAASEPGRAPAAPQFVPR